MYPAIMSSSENKDMQIISKVMAEHQKDDVISSRYQAHMQMIGSSSGSSAITPSSPTPIEPTISSTTEEKSSDSPSTTVQQQQQDDGMDITSISSGRAVHTVWHDDTPGNFDIFYKRDGADFDPTTINLSNNAGSSVNPAIAVSGNNVHIAWSDFSFGNFDIFYRRSFDGGATFGPIINLSDNAGSSGRPAIAIFGNNVHVVWQDDTAGNTDILYRKSADGGASFTGPIKNLSGNAGVSIAPAMAASGNNVHVVWEDNTPGNSDILYRRSIDGGSTFPNIIKNLSSNAGFSFNPAIAVSGNNVHVVWQDVTGETEFDILYRRSLDGGNTFPNIIKNLSGTDGASGDPAIAVSGDNVHVVWDDNTPGNSDILYRRSIDGGSTFPNIIKNLSSNAGSSADPAVALSGNSVYVVWRDLTPGNADILYRTSSDNGDTFPSLLTNLSVNAGSSTSTSIAAS